MACGCKTFLLPSELALYLQTVSVKKQKLTLIGWQPEREALIRNQEIKNGP